MSAPLRIAVCSSDGRMVDEHFGTTPQFLILDIDSETVKFTEFRENQPACQEGSHGGDAMAKSVELIADCQILLTVRAGPPVLARFAAKGIQVIQVTTSIAEALETLRSAPGTTASTSR